MNKIDCEAHTVDSDFLERNSIHFGIIPLLVHRELLLTEIKKYRAWIILLVEAKPYFTMTSLAVVIDLFKNQNHSLISYDQENSGGGILILLMKWRS